MLKAAIIGATGYTGGELLRLLSSHPSVRITAATSEQSAGKPVGSLFPYLASTLDLVLEPLDLEVVSEKADFFFLALPHTTAMSKAARLIQKGKQVVDLSADFRLKDPALYPKWYKTPHTHPELLKTAVYGLPELYRSSIKKASLVANPGCFPTGALLGLIPLLNEPLVLPDGIVIDAISGVSGAGRSPKLDYHFPEINESALAYNVTDHRHRPEINQALSVLAKRPIHAAFTPHLIPMTRGILTTMYARTQRAVETGRLTERFETHYKNEPFVRVLPLGEWPSTRNVRGSNFCHISVSADPDAGQVIVVTAIDNLVKGASGQAVQNMNLMAGFNETQGLESPGLFP